MISVMLEWVKELLTHHQELTAVAASVTAATAVFAAIYSYWQYKTYRSNIRKEREEKIENDTIELMSRYETDPTLYRAERVLNLIKRRHRNKNEKDKYDLSNITDKEREDMEFYLTVMLNFYEGLAYKTLRGFVNRKTVEDQYKHIIIKHVTLFMEGEEYGEIIPPDGEPLFPLAKAEKEWFPELMNLYREFTSAKE